MRYFNYQETLDTAIRNRLSGNAEVRRLEKIAEEAERALHEAKQHAVREAFLSVFEGINLLAEPENGTTGARFGKRLNVAVYSQHIEINNSFRIYAFELYENGTIKFQYGSEAHYINLLCWQDILAKSVLIRHF